MNFEAFGGTGGLVCCSPRRRHGGRPSSNKAGALEIALGMGKCGADARRVNPDLALVGFF